MVSTSNDSDDVTDDTASQSSADETDDQSKWPARSALIFDVIPAVVFLAISIFLWVIILLPNSGSSDFRVERDIPAWGPDRPLYGMNDPASYATLNSIKDNDGIPHQNEINFFQITEDRNDDYRQAVVLEKGVVYRAMIYFDNDVAPNVNAPSRSTALHVDFPTAMVGDSTTATATITSETTLPYQVYSSVALAAYDTLTLRYLDGSATIHVNDKTYPADFSKLSDSEIPLGCGPLEDNLDGSDRCRGYLEFKFVADYKNYENTIFLRKWGTTRWTKSLELHQGDSFDVESRFWNSGTTFVNDVKFIVSPPTGIEQEGPMLLYDRNSPKGYTINQPAGLLAGTGVLVGTYGGSTVAYLRSSWKVGAIGCGDYTIAGAVRTEDVETPSDGVTIKIVGCK